jgi:hypothetical protein
MLAGEGSDCKEKGFLLGRNKEKFLKLMWWWFHHCESVKNYWITGTNDRKMNREKLAKPKAIKRKIINAHSNLD